MKCCFILSDIYAFHFLFFSYFAGYSFQYCAEEQWQELTPSCSQLVGGGSIQSFNTTEDVSSSFLFVFVDVFYQVEESPRYSFFSGELSVE